MTAVTIDWGVNPGQSLFTLAQKHRWCMFAIAQQCAVYTGAACWQEAACHHHFAEHH